METYQLHYFAATARTGSMLAAARECAVTQPALSVQIKALEDELGVRLFDRHARGARLTRAGERMLATANRVLAELGQLRRELAGPLAESAPIFRVGIQPALATEVMPRPLRQCMAEFPDWQMALRERPNDVLLELLFAEQVDLCLMSKLPRWPAGLVTHELFTVRFAVYCLVGHPLALRRQLRLRDLLPHAVLLFNSPANLANRLQHLALPLDATLRVPLTCDQAATAFALAARGAGVALLPAVFGRRCAEAGMKEIMLRDAGLAATICAVWRRKSTLPPVAERLLALVRSGVLSAR